jgi:hypothetical protein
MPPPAVLPAEVLDLRPVAVPTGRFWRKLVAFSGPGYLVAVGIWTRQLGDRPGGWR